jgi:tellurite resistance protein TehA-like permease
MNALFLVYLIVEVIFGIGFLFVPGLMMGPMGVTLDETSTTFARLLGSLIISIPVLLFLARKSASTEFRRGVVYCIFTYLLLSTIILLITQLKGLMNPLGWGIVILHFVFMLWFGYYLINQGKMDSSR